MKNSILHYLSLFSIVLTLAACSKEIQPEQNLSAGQQYTPDEIALWSKINNFNQKIKFGLKTEQFITPDSAVWYLEALFNVQQATDTTFDDVVTYKQNYILAVNENGTVNMSDVSVVYSQLVADLQVQLQNIEAEYKFLIIADLQQTGLKSGDLEMELTAGLGVNPLSLYEPITTSDNWFYGNMLGRCDGTFFGLSDAGQELKRRFNNPEIAIPFQYNAWVNVNHSNLVSNQSYPGRVFYKYSITPPCITYDSLQYYLSQGHYIIYNTSTDNPSGEKFEGLYFKVIDLWTNNPNPQDSIFWHKYLIWYGSPVNIPPVE